MLGASQDDDNDEASRAWAAKCVCGKTFMQPSSYAFHIGFCKKFKGRLGQRLSDAKQRRRDESALHDDPPLSAPTSSNTPMTTAGPAQTRASETSGNMLWGRKRKPGWIDDDNLDVDIIISPQRAELVQSTVRHCFVRFWYHERVD